MCWSDRLQRSYEVSRSKELSTMHIVLATIFLPLLREIILSNTGLPSQYDSESTLLSLTQLLMVNWLVRCLHLPTRESWSPRLWSCQLSLASNALTPDKCLTLTHEDAPVCTPLMDSFVTPVPTGCFPKVAWPSALLCSDESLLSFVVSKSSIWYIILPYSNTLRIVFMSLKRKFQSSKVLIFKVLKTVYINQPLKRKTFRGDLSHSSAHG